MDQVLNLNVLFPGPYENSITGIDCNVIVLSIISFDIENEMLRRLAILPPLACGTYF